MALLYPAPPRAAQLLGVGAVGVAGGQEGGHGASVHALPREIVIGEGIALVVAPEDLLGHEVVHAAPLQQLRQHRGIAEGIRQPQHAAVHAELVLIILLAVDQLTHQRLAGGHVGIRLHVHRALGDPAAFFCRRLDAGEQLRIILLAHFVGRRLALQIVILRVALQQAKLRREGAGGLAVGLVLRPQPRKVKVSVADGPHLGGGGAVVRLHQGL